MRNYRKLTRVVLSLLLAGGIFLVGSIIVRQNIPDDYIGAQRAYLTVFEQRLGAFDAIESGQRIALIGSSPIIIGLSAEQIEIATGTTTRNLAMNSSRAVFKDYAEMVFEHLRPGDVVVIVNPNLTRAARFELPLSCVRTFEFKCIRAQEGRRPRIINDALVLFTDRAFGYETLNRNDWGDFVFPEDSSLQTRARPFGGPFPENSAGGLAELAAGARRAGACPIIVLTPFFPDPEEHTQWQSEIDLLRERIEDAGLADITVGGELLWPDPTLFHHHQHPSERGRELWTRDVVAKLQENGLPAGCGRVDLSAN